MKKTILNFGLFLLAVLLPTGCSSDEDDEIKGNVIEQVAYGNDITEFFNKQVPFLGSKCLYLYNVGTLSSKDYLIINSQEEYANTFQEYEGTLPEIDFSRYSLIIGSLLYQQPQKKGDKVPKEPKRQLLYKTNDGYTLELYYSYEEVGSDDAITSLMQYVNYWGIFPKLAEGKMDVILKYV